MASWGKLLATFSRSKFVQVGTVSLLLYLVYLYYASVPKPSFRNHSGNIQNTVDHQNLDAAFNKKSADKSDSDTDNNDIINDKTEHSQNEKLSDPNNVAVPKRIKPRKGVNPSKIDVVLLFSNAKQNFNLQEKFKTCVSSILKFVTIDITFHIIGDKESQKIGKGIIDNNAKDVKIKYTIEHLDVDTLAKKLHAIVSPMQELFSYKPGAYYSDSLFFLSIAIHKVMPEHMHKVIMLDADLKFQTDISQLYDLFFHFRDSNVMGIARDMQPVYRHTFWQYRKNNPGTRVGEPPPDGLTGFNSGVLLLDLQRMRSSELYNKLISKDEVTALSKKFNFKGHLGDQDFFTLVNMQYEELFFVLPCTWNRQLCQWWKDKGYQDVFDLYFKCEGKINIYHGNCNTPIP